MLDFNFNLGNGHEPLKNAPKELTDEIKSFRQKNKEFAATNEHETYLIVVFSTKDDKEEFCDNAGITEHTMVDGYELAKHFKISPTKPKFKLAKPIANNK